MDMVGKEPKGCKKALACRILGLQWGHTMDDEVTQLIGRGTFTEVSLEDIYKASRHDSTITLLRTHFVFKIKTKDDGFGHPTLDKLKARLVAGGDKQSYGDYLESYAPVVKFETFKILIALMTMCGLQSCSIDFVGAYLNSVLKEDNLYGTFPSGYKRHDSQGRETCMHFRKGLYGLVQSGAAWHRTLRVWLLAYGFESLKSDPCVYMLISGVYMLIVCTYVDDCLILFNCKDLKDRFLAAVGDPTTGFEVKVSDTMSWFLGVQVVRTPTTTQLDARKMINEKLLALGLANATPKPTSVVPLQPSKQNAELLGASDATWHRMAVGALMYVMTWRPDVSYAATACSKKMQAPTVGDRMCVCRVWRYLKGTINGYILTYHVNPSPIHHPSPALARHCGATIAVTVLDANWKAPRSTSSFTTFVAGASVMTKTKEQDTTALSTFDSESMAFSFSTSFTVWAVGLWREFAKSPLRTKIGGHPLVASPIPTLTDNAATCFTHQEYAVPTRARHIMMRCHFSLDAVAKKLIAAYHIPTGENPADLGTKPLDAAKHHKHASTVLGCPPIDTSKVGPDGIYLPGVW